jgi:GNAT superfamily N-acetyltransferase
MTLSDQRDAALEAFCYLAKGISSSFPNAVFKHDEDTDIVWTGNKLVILNGAFRRSQPESLAELEHTLKYVESQFRELDKGTGGIVVWEAGTLLENGVSKEAIKEVAAKYNIKAKFDTTMAREGRLFDKVDLRGMEVRKNETDKEIGQLFRMHFPNDATDWSYPAEFWKSLNSYSGYVDGKLVTTATTHLHKGDVFLSCVGTDPDYRNRGYGTAISKYALQQSLEESGSKISFLHASEMGRPLYEKLGFKEIGTGMMNVYNKTTPQE